MGGTPVFMGTRVPIKNLFDYLEGGEPVSEFLEITLDELLNFSYVLKCSHL